VHGAFAARSGGWREPVPGEPERKIVILSRFVALSVSLIQKVSLHAFQVSFRRDPESFRPRINKRDSLKDREQKAAGDYFVVEE